MIAESGAREVSAAFVALLGRTFTESLVVSDLGAVWLVPVSLVAAVALGIFRYYGGSFRAVALGRVTAANAVTLLRGAGLAGLAAFLVVEPANAWLPAAVYGVVAALDRVDGALARHFDAVTDLGTALDREYDALSLSVGPLVAAAVTGAPLWFAAVGLVRVPHIAHLEIRRRRGLPVGDLPPSRLRRPLAGGAMVATALLLAPGLGPLAREAIALVVGGPFLLRYGADWLAAVSGGEQSAETPTEPLANRGGDT